MGLCGLGQVVIVDSNNYTKTMTNVLFSQYVLKDPVYIV